MIDFHTIPADVDKLKALIRMQVQEHETTIKDFTSHLQSKEEVIQHQKVTLHGLHRENEFLREALRLARMARFAATSEKLPSGQQELFNEAEVLAREEKAADDHVEDRLVVPAHTRKRPIRKPLPEHLPREIVVIDLADEDKICAHDGTRLQAIGEDVAEQLDIIPAQMKVIRTIRKKYVCPCCEATVITAKLPEKMLPKSNATPGLLAYIAVSKYVDALPLYRLEQIFQRADIELPRNTMAAWMIAVAEKLQPLYNLMEEDLLASDYVCCDETTVQVLHEPGKAPQSKSYMWVRSRHGPGINPIVLFDYDPTRSKEVPRRLLRDFQGYLQVDGYGSYDEVCRKPEVIRVGCMAHVRRKFFEAHKISKKAGGEANRVLQMIQKLYKIEEDIKEETIEHRFSRRQEQSVPLLNEITTWLDANEKQYPPQGLMGKAVGYARHQWPHVMRYVEHGKLSIDNNFTENRIRPFAVGRKNWLFSDSVAGAEASAMMYSILQTARGNGLEPYAYLRHVFTELPKANTAEQIEKLLPHTIDPKILA